MPYPLVAMGAATGLGRLSAWFATSKAGQTISQVLYNPFVQSGQFGIGYTGGAYLGYGASNISFCNRNAYDRTLTYSGDNNVLFYNHHNRKAS